MLGYDEEEIKDSLDEWLDRVHPEDRGTLQIALTSLVQGPNERLSAEYRIKHRNGNYLWARCSGLAERDENTPIRIIGSQTDITSFKVTEERLMHDAFHDPLTGLANRAHFQERLDRALERTKRNKEFHFALLFLDLDKLKMVNDTFGHDAGDRLLAETGRRPSHASDRPTWWHVRGATSSPFCVKESEVRTMPPASPSVSALASGSPFSFRTSRSMSRSASELL